MSKYDVKMDNDPASIAGKMMSRIRKGAEVLEFGCAEGRMTRYMQESLGCRVTVVEIDPEAYAVARQYAADGWCGDAESLGWSDRLRERQFDFVLFADVLEHLRDPEAVLRAVKPFLKDDGEVLISIPNIAHNDILTKLYLNRFDYTDIGLLDDTHIHFWGVENVGNFAQRAGYALCVLDGVSVSDRCTEQGIGVSRNDTPSELEEALKCRQYRNLYQMLLVLQTAEWAASHQLKTENRMEDIRDTSDGAALYWKVDGGYSAENSQIVFPQIEKDGYFRFFTNTIPADCAFVRFDPVENIGCVIRGLSVKSDGRDCPAAALNGYCCNDLFLFTDNDPQLEFGIPRGTKELEIRARITRMDELMRRCVDDALRARAEQIDKDNAVISQQQAQLTEKSAAITIQQEKLAEKCAVIASQQERLTEQGTVIASQQKQLSEQSELLLQQQNRITYREMKIEQQKAECEELTARLSDQRIQLDEQAAAIAQQQAQLAERDRRLLQLNASLDQQQNQITMLQYQYECINQAFFWKITKPLRALLDAFKKNRLLFLLDKGIHSIKAFGVKATWAKVKNYRRKQTAISQMNAVEVRTENRAELSLAEFLNVCKAGGEVFGEDILLGHKASELVLLVSHELNLTGAPIALQYFAESLLRQGMLPVVIAPHDDALRPVLTGEGIPVLTHPALYQSSFVADFASLFSMVVVNTNVGAPIVSRLSGSDIPVLWWIHEAHASYHPGALAAMPESLGENIHVYCAGNYAQMLLRHYRPRYNSKILLYCLPDFAKQVRQADQYLQETDGKTVFTLIGSLEERKGQDVLAEAICLLSDEERKRSLFVFIGKEHHTDIHNAVLRICEKFPESVVYIPGLSREDIKRFYAQVDCAICASRDDPMPITVTEALALSKPVICSENTGSAALLRKTGGGILYGNNSPAALSEKIRLVLRASEKELTAIGAKGRLTYERYFTEAVFEKTIREIVEPLCSAGKSDINTPISIVIPTYNAGEDFEPLLKMLLGQRGVSQPEIVIVDSGSKDGTPDIARKYGAKVIEIPQERFSHSYARNLGMEKASGKYVLVMTQDAVPSGRYWLWRLTQPIVNDGVAAVSCRQTPKPDCDLLGRVGLYIHAEYMGILGRDRVLSLPKDQDFNSLRKNAQLDDVACLYDREVFLKFRYRGSYAEDLDIGLRMIRAGYKLALLSSAPVIHSHTRPAYYHLKRGVVDVAVLKKILPDFPIHTENAAGCMDRIITAYAAEKMFADDLLHRCALTDIDALHQWTDAEFEQIRNRLRMLNAEELRSLILSKSAFTDEKLQRLVIEFSDTRGAHFRLNDAATFDQAYFIKMHLLPFLHRQAEHLDDSGKAEIADALEKHAGQLSGNLLAGYVVNHSGEDAYLDEVCRELSKGV